MAEYGKDDVVVPQVDEIAVYYNQTRDIVICQRDPMGNDDHVIVVPFQHLKALLGRLRELGKNRPETDG